MHPMVKEAIQHEYKHKAGSVLRAAEANAYVWRVVVRLCVWQWWIATGLAYSGRGRCGGSIVWCRGACRGT